MDHTTRYFRAAAVVIVVFVMAMIARNWDARTGFTSLIRFGEFQSSRHLPVVRALPVALVPGEGYDGQYYAQLSLKLDPRGPENATALGTPAYRARRILLPAVAHFLAFGDPWRNLQIYALLNIAAWLALAWIWWKECPPDNGGNFLRWCGGTLALGTLDSVRMALTDLPCTLLLVLAVRAARSARPRIAAAWGMLATLVRETALLGLLVVARDNGDGDPDAPPSRKTRIETWALRAAMVAPLLGYVLWLRHTFPDESLEIAGNLDWPGFGFARHVLTCTREIASGNLDTRYTFGLLAALGFAWQSIFLLRRWRSNDPWTKLGVPFALLFWFLGDYVWHGYWAVARVSLPMTFAFVRIAPLRAPWIFANLSALHGIVRMM